MGRFLSVLAVGVLWLLSLYASALAKPGTKQVSLQFAETEIGVVLSILAEQVGFDAVIGPGMESIVSVSLTDVDWEIALDALVMANGLIVHWNDDVLVVLASGDQVGGVMEHRVVSLKHADPLAVKAVLTSVLSANASIEVLGGTTGAAATPGAPAVRPAPVLVISESPYNMPAILLLIAELDVPRPQFEIAVRFVETSLDDEKGFGFNWPTRISATVSDYDRTGTSTGGTQSTGTTPSAEFPIPDGKIWRFGTLSIDQLNGFVEFLEQNGESHLLSDPRVTVLENETAQMRVTTTFPVQTVTRFSEGAATQDIVDFINIEVGLNLLVTPRLNDSGVVTLQVEPSVEEITGFTGPADNQRPITANRRVKTSVRVGDNETLVIGGLVREVDVTTKRKIFLLGDIPLLGALFTHERVDKQKTDLLIFITPRVLADATK
ncbi:MAG TPA: hypothetical protein VM118_04820 [Acidobacteriota bacterium]|nr:hypothetical protein [Acidobacteriota bacterium]